MSSFPAEPPDRKRELRDYSALVRKIAARLRARLPANVEMDDLLQAGLIGLNEAIERYETSFGASFDTYASRRIEGAMLDALRAEDTLSRDARGRQREIKRVVQALEHRLLRAPRASEVACELGWSLAKLHACLVEAGATAQRAGDSPLDDEPPDEASARGAADEAPMRGDEHADPLRALQRRQRSAALNAAFDQLEERERTVMQMIYERGLEHRDAAATLGISPARVSQLHTAIVEKLKRRLRDW
ncbi:MAG: FliA/WhiG family RNA polymerase sigma factor [Methylibium sp.]|uniref:sigma-70 family RNA polymerase sigma factor n=1 Tax=Methylibium sp. TaxID=2067992 RepID=UPI0018513D19|nr:FliA/WhiG family RNA polymerase sigma factor [Methylibium sp.]MBA3598587.1 FliA/WhiG family RNA polymerase sigma factor [Methylibium sp.]